MATGRRARMLSAIAVMLTTLRIRNLALVADLTLELQPGFNAITGETGAGKSVIIGALNLLMGQRADRTLLRTGTDTCTVEAVFEVGRLRDDLNALLEQSGLEPMTDSQLLLKRSFTANGANRQFINGSPAPLSALAALGERLVDIHGPHDHQSLFHLSRQLDLLDAYGGHGQARAALAEQFSRRAELLERRRLLMIDDQTCAQRIDLLRHQVQEIESARLQPDEAERIETEHARAQNAVRLLDLSQAALNTLAGDDGALIDRAGQLGRLLTDLARLDSSAEPLHEHQVSLMETLRDLESALSHYVDGINLDPARLQELEERLDLLNSLRRKYGSTIPEILAFAERARAELEQLEQRDAEMARIDSEIAAVADQLMKQAAALTEARKRIIPRLEKSVAAQLRDLGFRQAGFHVHLGRAGEIQRTGIDAIEFQFAPNPGEPPRPLRAIASSGELARVMLALKSVLAVQDDIPVVVFDEVDANIAGETAHAVGEKMRQIGERRQVLCITHLAPVAAAGNAHYVVNKSSREGRTISAIRPVTNSDRVQELARMLGGGPAAEQHATALIASRNGAKPRGSRQSPRPN